MARARKTPDAATLLLPTERDFSASAARSAASLGYTLRYHTWMSLHSAKGFPDLVLLRPSDGRLVVAEMKGRTTTVQPEQQTWLDALAQARAPEVYLWRVGKISDQQIVDLLAGPPRR